MPEFRSGDLTLFYIDEPPVGQDRREPILLIHGFASNHAVNWVNTGWVKALQADGRRVIALDNRGHGRSDKPRRPEDYHTDLMATDAVRLLDHLGLERVDVMGYSMGARITAFLASMAPERTRSALLGGLGIHLLDGTGLPQSIADALEAPSLDAVSGAMPRMFRRFADATGGDLGALAACIRGSRQSLSTERLARILVPVLVSVGTRDDIAGDPHALARLLIQGRALDIPDRDHNLAVGDKVHKAGVLAFLAERP
ncbi:alpha/beta hydrolase [Lichenihabitans sp. Uapishka_5]|uniref:alpha/beta fold hydrolase n=1 Tax=Lichenihabitans sp. Uapishka_5 TaxID=3037302 RepID=UPI0029E7F04D|nr:alpha/beta hydrolase [Lichenihabitans sp. Uapishka_5]MDX7949658.1 alpha/beta hydrolase [Lichenihabitans sp. Uapishka_5]